jgi:uncharacterized protein (TIGR02118 family)
MMVVSIQFPDGADVRFDMDYYLNVHLPLCRRRWGSDGPITIQVLVGRGDPRNEAFKVQTLLTFGSGDHLARLRESPHTQELLADIPRFTNVHPVIQINERTL